MQFDARAAKQLQPGQHLTVDDAPGLRLVCTAAGRSWIYRYKSPVDGRMRQVKLGTWPALSAAAAGAGWEAARNERSSGVDPAKQRRAARKAEKVQAVGFETVGDLLDAYVDKALKERAA
ncbi:MAG: integrase arm-type DNA-binding domain-containing protein [Inhella sp.]